MGVLTKPDLAIERAMQNIAIDHVTGKRCDLLLGYHIVKNRGPDDGESSLAVGLEAEENFFSEHPWAALKSTEQNWGRGAQDQEFPKLREEIKTKLVGLKAMLDGLGAPRSDHTRAFSEDHVSKKSRQDSEAPMCEKSLNTSLQARLSSVTYVPRSRLNFWSVLSVHSRHSHSNPHFNDALARAQQERVLANIKTLFRMDDETWDSREPSHELPVSKAAFKSLHMTSHSNAESMQQHIHDVFKSYYKVVMKRFADNVCLQVVHHYLLFAEDGPLKVFNSKLVHSMDAEQLDVIAGESAAVKSRRNKLGHDIATFEKALEVLDTGVAMKLRR
ncbi:hypothetical protein PpBr36_07772 [Pyricularia pennisetigena]|uniref:hypothetical protein n=1 Tax=Pyricularia pennisetigena TaxID=1578925 RepID=UPI00114F893E|nr:hypothetical protein PpBr36_07772 [Pyricularia pennisetigena]TLS25403.1 hypothetical protein PpBr36_07772 [Pyricularia pennisetigena]